MHTSCNGSDISGSLCICTYIFDIREAIAATGNM